MIGLIVGEGTFTGDKHHPYIGIKAHFNDPNPIRMFPKHLGGKIYGPYLHDKRHYWFWKLHRMDELKKAINFFDKYLPVSLKLEKYNAWKIKYSLC
jgi:hypothetical protein